MLGNDSDPDGDAISAVWVSDPSHGTLDLNNDGSFNYTPVANFNGGDSFTYKVKDIHNAESAPATVSITVNEVNQPPVLTDPGDKTVDELTELSFNLNATDPDIPAQTLTYSIQSGSETGMVLNPNTGAFSWTPTEEQGPGTYTVTFRVTDDGTPQLFNKESITITVNEVKQPPTISITVTSPNGGESWTIGSTRTITWSSTSLPAKDKVKIGLSRYSGSTWSTIVSSTPNTGSKTWKVSGPGIVNARIRVSAVSNPSVSDTSDADFIIKLR